MNGLFISASKLTFANSWQLLYWSPKEHIYFAKSMKEKENKEKMGRGRQKVDGGLYPYQSLCWTFSLQHYMLMQFDYWE